MTPAAILAILVATGEAHAAPTTAMAAAAAEVIGTPGGVRVVEAPALADTEALRVERERFLHVPRLPAHAEIASALERCVTEWGDMRVPSALANQAGR